MDLGQACRRGSKGVLLVALAAFASVFVAVALLRLRFPYEIEWMEGGMLGHAARLLDGKPIYARPSTDFVAFFYTPLYSAVVALLAKVFGLGFALGRGVSLAATLATSVLLFHIGRREASVAAGAVAAGLYLAHFRFCGAFYDVARPDALSLAILLAGVWCARVAKSPRGAALAGALLALAFLTKQTTSVFVPVVAAALLFERGWRHATAFAVTAGLVAGLTCAWLEHRSSGWFWFYVFEGHQAHKFYWRNILLEYWRDVLFLAPALLVVPIVALSLGKWTRWIALAGAALVVVAFAARATTLHFGEHMYYQELLYEKTRPALLVPPLLVAALAVWARVRDREAVEMPAGFWLALFGAGALASGLNHSTQWAYSNCFMPIALFGSLAVALSLPLEKAITTWPSAAMMGAVVVALVPLAYIPSAQLPPSGDAAALSLLSRRLDDVGGKVLTPAHPMLAYDREHTIHLHQMGFSDLSSSGGIQDLRARLASGEWAGVVVDSDSEVPFLDEHYYPADRFLYDDAESLFARTGTRVRPRMLWRAQNTMPHDLSPGVTGNFERGAYDGWTASGGFAAAPSRRAGIANAAGMQGGWAARTVGAGSLTSAPFAVTRARITFLARATGLAYVTITEGATVHSRTNVSQGAAIHPASADTSDLIGHTVVVTLVNEGGADAVFDDVRASF
jgi:Dolichyl-phosphate-mannose-protein mannosyltransferase